MKYAIYDKAADGYLTKMEFEVGYSENTQFECGYNEYITEAQLLDTPKEAADTIVRIESFKFMDKGRFVMHSFDDTLKDHYIISEAGKPTKVVDNITVDLDGTINVKCGTMVSHWSTAFLEYAINRMNTLQKAKDSRYTAWCNTFDIYKVINVIDEKSCTHYQFIKVTNKGLTEYAKNEVDPLSKRIEELERSNYELGEKKLLVEGVANRLQEENDALKTKVDAIKKEASNWKDRYKTASRDCALLENVIDNIYDDLCSTDICKNLNDTLNYVKDNIYSELNRIKILNDNTDDCEPIYISAATEFIFIINQTITIMKGLELNQSVAFASADEVEKAKGVAYDIIDICESMDDPFELTIRKFSHLYEAVNAVRNIDDDPIMHAFKALLLIFSTMDRKISEFVDELVTWKNKAKKAEKALDDQKKLNDANKATIARMVVNKSTADKRIKELRDTRGSMAEVIFAIRNAIYTNNCGAFDCIESRMVHDSIFNLSPFMAGVGENIKDICNAEKRNIANHELKNGEIAKAADALNEVNDKNEGLSNMLKEISYCVADIMFATKGTNRDITISELTYISNKIGVKTSDDGPIYGISVILNTIIRILKEGHDWKLRTEEAISDYTKCNEAIGEWKRKCEAKDTDYEMLKNKLQVCEVTLDSTHELLTKTIEERDKALERAEKFKGIANSVYGITVPGRCCGKQLMADILSGKKIPISKDKYDAIITSLKLIDLSYEGMYGTMIRISPKPKPTWLPGLLSELKDLTE